jgi:hypothetical protein
MKLPSAEEYLDLISSKPPGSLATLNNYHFVSNADGRPWFRRSRQVIVFKAEFNSQTYSIRFFLNDDAELFRRYHLIQDYLQQVSVSWKTAFTFLDEEYYPVVKMDWVDGYSLGEYIDLTITKPVLLGQLQSKLVALSRSLEEQRVAHGNLNLNHIRLKTEGSDHVIKLIDYDSMFVPSLQEKDSLSAGTSSFQHPMRLSSDFNETIDRFSIWVLVTALEAFKLDPSLWTRAEQYGYDKSKQVLFNYRDLAFPQQSRALQILKKYNNDALNYYAEKLVSFCTSKTLEAIEAPQLYGTRDAVRPVVKEKLIQQPVKAPEPVKETIQRPVIVPRPQPKAVALPEQKTVTRKEEHRRSEVKPIVQEKQKADPAPKKKTSVYYVVLTVVVVLAFTSFFILGGKDDKTENITETQSSPAKALPVDAQPQKETQQQKETQPPSQETVFTSTNIAQFLFQLYQSYNKRDLQGILSNYTDSLSQYYDTYAVNKPELTGMIKNLFIAPTFYECEPDIRTLKFTNQGDVCRLTVGVKETIQANRRSKKENYTSTIEYTVDRSFKIFSERNIQ